MIPDKAKFLEVLTDVVIRYKGHDAYKGFEGALKALKKRTEGYSLPVCREALEISCRVYDTAALLIADKKYITKKTTSIYSEFEDVDFEACLNELKKAEPAGEKVYSAIMSWVILWFYLK
jgi:hypothetical protein